MHHYHYHCQYNTIIIIIIIIIIIMMNMHIWMIIPKHVGSIATALLLLLSSSTHQAGRTHPALAEPLQFFQLLLHTLLQHALGLLLGSEGIHLIGLGTPNFGSSVTVSQYNL